MKKIFLTLLLCFISSSMAAEKKQLLSNDTLKALAEVKVKTDQETKELVTQKPEAQKSDFNLKTEIKNPNKLEKLVVSTMSVIEVESAKDIEKIISKGTKGLFFHRFFKETPLMSEFLYSLTKAPAAVAKFVGLFIKRNELIIFALVIILSLVLSHFLGEYKFKFKAMSFKRVAYSIFRFSLVNGIRLGAFGFLFVENIKPISKVAYAAVVTTKSNHPTLYEVSNFVAQYI